MDYDGIRYLTLSDFTSHCRNLNIDVSGRELEHYERERLLLPVARTVEPEEHFIARRRSLRERETSQVPAPPEEWNALQDDLYLADVPSRPAAESDHPFDREAGRNPYLMSPAAGWVDPTEYTTIINYGYGDISESRATTYYSYWQAHQVHQLQWWPDFYRNRSLVNAIPFDHPIRSWHELPSDRTPFSGFLGQAESYGALSLFVSRRARLRRIVFARAAQERDGYWELTSDEYTSLQTSLSAQAHDTLERTSLTLQGVLDFIGFLLDLHDQYSRAERTTLARSIERDIWRCTDLCFYAAGWDFERLQQELNPVIRRMLRDLQPIVAAQDRAIRNLTFITDSLGKKPEPSDSLLHRSTAPDEIAEYALRAGLFKVLDALAAYTYTSEEEAAAPYGFHARTLRLLGVAFEQFAKRIGEDAGARGETLTATIRSLLERDTSLNLPFAEFEKKRLHSAATTEAAAVNLTRIRNEVPSPIGQNLLLACLGRNVGVHFALTHWDDVRERRTIGALSGALGESFVQLWLLAVRNGWVLKASDTEPSPT